MAELGLSILETTKVYLDMSKSIPVLKQGEGVPWYEFQVSVHLSFTGLYWSAVLMGCCDDRPGAVSLWISEEIESPARPSRA